MPAIELYNCQIAIHCVGFADGGDLRRLQEYLAACGPASYSEILVGMQIVEYALLDHLAAARDVGLVELVNGKYRVREAAHDEM